jgi:predicted Fe-Mo cluster-binding NifX family protein
MKVAVSASSKDLDSPIDPRFGRCAYFVVVETDDMGFEAFDNQNAALGGGAGIQAAQFVASKGAKAVLTGNCGPNAVRTLNAAGIEVFVGQSGTVREAVERYRQGALTHTTQPNVPDHFGMGGRMGRGRGMGMGRRAAAGSDPTAQERAAEPADRENLEDLRAQMKALREQLAAIENSIERLSKK